MSFYLTDEQGYRSEDFPTQADAEAWLTSEYEDLVDRGVRTVSLFRDADRVYGPMSLLP